ncbi:hypothetical protein WAZ07_08105 [Bacillus sp. FJAT-51639]|uniref:Transcriptional regulator n=1 Tax=Bacillus bruguierae TaxID=3127667 RepID=A0ABU8FHX4_9BACI
MLPNILLKIEEKLKENSLLSDSQLDKFMLLLKRYKKGEWLYPGVLIRKLNITSSNAYKLLDSLKDIGVLEVNYELYCHTCNTFEGTIYETFSQVPNDLHCEGCGIELKPLVNSIVIYKVIIDGEQ